MFLAKQHVRNLGIAAGSEPLGLVVATADMGIDHHAFGCRIDHSVIDGCVLTLNFLRITSKYAVLKRFGNKHAPCAIIKLKIAASRVEQVLGNLGVCLNQSIGQIVIALVRVGEVFGCACLQQEQGLCRGRHGDLRHGIIVLELLDELKVLDERMILSGNLTTNGRCLAHLGSVGTVHGNRIGALRHPIEAPHEIEVPVGATELSIGDHVKSGGLLLGYQFGDGLVFDGLKVIGIDLACGEVRAGGLELRRTQIGTDHIGMERSVVGIRHLKSSSFKRAKYLEEITRRSKEKEACTNMRDAGYAAWHAT